jgi:hypothetical protein
MDRERWLSITVQVPREFARELRALLGRHPDLSFIERGWLSKDFTISGPAIALAEFEPALKAWQFDCASRDAW